MDITDMAQRIIAGERRALARAITLVESGRADHRAQATELLAALGQNKQALRIGLSVYRKLRVDADRAGIARGSAGGGPKFVPFRRVHPGR